MHTIQLRHQRHVTKQVNYEWIKTTSTKNAKWIVSHHFLMLKWVFFFQKHAVSVISDGVSITRIIDSFSFVSSTQPVNHNGKRKIYLSYREPFLNFHRFFWVHTYSVLFRLFQQFLIQLSHHYHQHHKNKYIVNIQQCIYDCRIGWTLAI